MTPIPESLGNVLLIQPDEDIARRERTNLEAFLDTKVFVVKTQSEAIALLREEHEYSFVYIMGMFLDPEEAQWYLGN